jgi:hypothetical protein
MHFKASFALAMFAASLTTAKTIRDADKEYAPSAYIEDGLGGGVLGGISIGSYRERGLTCCTPPPYPSRTGLSQYLPAHRQPRFVQCISYNKHPGANLVVQPV